MVNLLTDSDNFLTIVGDDDQSIYGWRGADIENIQRFLKEKHPRHDSLRAKLSLYGHILKASNQLIQNNSDRLGKELWTSGEDGEPISIYSAFNDYDEVRYVTSNYKHGKDAGNNLVNARFYTVVMLNLVYLKNS